MKEQLCDMQVKQEAKHQLIKRPEFLKSQDVDLFTTFNIDRFKCDNDIMIE